MMEIQLICFDDRAAQRWEPFALTRPLGELFYGTMTIRRRIERVLALRCRGHLCAPHLAGFEEEGAPPVLENQNDTANPRLYLVSRFVPAWGAEFSPPKHSGAVADSGGNIVGWYSPAGDPPPPAALIEDLDTEADPLARIAGFMVDHVWDLIHLNPDQIAADIRALFDRPRASHLATGVHHWGGHPLVVDHTAHIEPGAALDTSAGPIWLDEGARVRSFARLVGPAYIGRNSTVLGGPVEAVSVGPVCKVRGELAESICVGYVNKQHDGHIGHAYLGRWVNLGAETTNSDLKNNYGTIRLWTPDGDVDTGQIKMGSLIGDHVKTGIGLLLNTGTVIGAGSNLYGADMPPKYVPPFSWGTGDQLVEYRLDKFLEVAEKAMERRDVPLGDGLRSQLSAAWTRGRESAGT